jgi:adenylate cyclase
VSRLTAAELAWQAGTTPEHVDRLAGRGIIGADPSDGLFDSADIHRVRLAEAMLHAGVSLDDMARLVEEGKYSFRYIEDVFPQAAPPLLDKTYAEVAAEVGLSMDVVEQLYTNWSLPPPAPDQRIRADDAEILRGRGRLVSEFGLDHDSVVAASRFFGENLRRMAESQVRFFRSRVIEKLRESGLSWAQVLDAIGPIAGAMRGGSDQLRAQLYDRHLEDYIFQQAVEMFEATMDDAGYGSPRPVQPPAIAFLDMGGYTLLTQKAGDEAAAELAAKLVGLVRRASRDYGGEAVKLLGDGVMFHFPQADKAVACGLELVEAAEREGLPPARMGADAGPVVFRDGDYFGQTVNVAARISDYARPGEVLVSQAVIEEVPEAGFEFDPIGEIPLKGVREPVLLYRALNRHSSPAS